MQHNMCYLSPLEVDDLGCCVDWCIVGMHDLRCCPWSLCCCYFDDVAEGWWCVVDPVFLKITCFHPWKLHFIMHHWCGYLCWCFMKHHACVIIFNAGAMTLLMMEWMILMACCYHLTSSIWCTLTCLDMFDNLLCVFIIFIIVVDLGTFGFVDVVTEILLLKAMQMVFNDGWAGGFS